MGEWRKMQLLCNQKAMKNPQLLGKDLGMSGSAEVSIVVVASIPKFAELLGFDTSFPDALRMYAGKHGLEGFQDLDDEEIWQQLEDERKDREERKETLKGWSNLLQLEREGRPAGTLHASPGEALTLTVTGFAHNNNGDSCMQQVLLGLDTQAVAEILDGVPHRGRDIREEVTFPAPDAPGTYMLWRYTALQEDMALARRDFSRDFGDIKNHYPKEFVGWLVVLEQLAGEK